MHAFLLIGAVVAIGATSAQQTQFRLTPIDRSVIERRLESVPQRRSDRGAKIREIFAEAGCGPERLSEQAVKGTREPNIICSISGEGSGRIVVGAHYDSSDAGAGVVDNWSGAALLASLYEALAKQPRRHTIQFAAFSGEEAGLYGSTGFVKGTPRGERSSIQAMINLDCVGMTPTKVNLHGSDKVLAQALAAVARAMGVSLAAVNVGNVGQSDAIPFRDAKIPTIDIHSITQDRLRILHSHQDTLNAIDRTAYWETYRLMLGYLVLLDSQLSGQSYSGSLQ